MNTNKVPDKIYLYKCKKQGIRTDGICTEWSEKPVILTEENIAYIRKEALLEFVNKQLQESADRLDFHANKAYAEVLDKLNEM